MFNKCGVSFFDVQNRCNLSAQDPNTILDTARRNAESISWCAEHGGKVLESRIRFGGLGDRIGAMPPYYCDVLCWSADLTTIKHRIVYEGIDRSKTKTTVGPDGRYPPTLDEQVEALFATEENKPVIENDGLVPSSFAPPDKRGRNGI